MATHHKSDVEIIATTHNVARFFTEHRQVALILLLATFVWGWFGYQNMPKRKDPNIPVRVASAQCQWPGATTEQVEQLTETLPELPPVTPAQTPDGAEVMRSDAPGNVAISVVNPQDSLPVTPLDDKKAAQRPSTRAGIESDDR